MFGYINPDKPHMFVKDEVLYQALYCGMCKSIGKACGNFSKSALTYDVAFMSATLHNLGNADVEIRKRHCILHIFKKRPMATPDEISLLLGCVNTALAYQKLLDDRQDGEKKGFFAFLYRRGYKRALKRHPRVAEIISEYMEEQRALEEAGCEIIDQACEPTAVMMQRLSAYVLKEYSTADSERLFYDVGKWIYLADALDDYEKDVKKGSYNVLYKAYKAPQKAQAVAEHGEEINFIFNSLFADMRVSLAAVKFYFNHDLTDNIILRGIPLRTRRLVYGKCGEGKKGDKDE